MRVRQIVFAGSTLALLTALTACGGTIATLGTPAPSTSTVVSTPATAAPTAAPDPKEAVPAAAGKAVSQSTASPFQVRMTTQRQGLGLLTLTNTSSDTVTVDGWPTLTFLNAANEEVPVPVRQVAAPGPGTTINLKPGQTAFAGMKWTDGNKGSTSTYVATTVKVTVSGATTPIPMSVTGQNGQPAGYYEFDVTSVEVGTLQPSPQGVLAF